MMIPTIDQILDIYKVRGQEAYCGESVTQLEHALQTAWLAERSGASDALVVAALLHDVGHLLSGLDEEAARRGIDDAHERAGVAWLRERFGPDVTEPIRLHVEAKRYLCAADRAYLERLSPASRTSLELQGGPMSAEEVRRFEANPFHRDAVGLRRWDDQAKVVGLDPPGLDHYRERLAAVWRGGDEDADRSEIGS